MTTEAAVLLHNRWLIALGLTLFHALWQAGLVVALAALVLREMRGHRAAVRYGVAYLALVSLPLVSAVTLWRIAHDPATASDLPFAAAAWLAPWAACAWIAGIGVSGLRLAAGWAHLRHLRATAERAAPVWQNAVDRVARRLGITRSVRVTETPLADVPGVIGWLSPLILFPAGILASLPPRQVQLILTHELAHIRRNDYFWNFLQVAVETMFFFHPAVRWLSRRVREEREHCCDDMVLMYCGDRHEYAEALTGIERLRGSRAHTLALAAGGGSLVERVRRIVDPPRRRQKGTALVALAAAVPVAIAVVGVDVASVPLVAEFASPPLWLGAALGLVIGVRHALEPDHLAAVSTLVADGRGAPRAVRLGLSWGLGHTLTLLLAGGALAVVQTTVPQRAAEVLEVAVGVMLIVLGLRALRSAHALATSGPETLHAHGSRVHVHTTSGEHVHVGPLALARRPLVVGMVHGVAGSGALAAMAMAALPTAATQILFMVLFGAGSTAGMAALSGLAGVPLAHLARRPAALAWVSAAAGFVSTIAGVIWSWPFISGLL